MTYSANHTARATAIINGQTYEGDHVKALYDELGTDPSGSGAADVTARLSNLDTTVSGKAATSHVHAATELTSGTVPITRLGASGVASSTTFLRGDNSWVTLSGGGGSGPYIAAGDNGVAVANSGSTNGTALRALVAANPGATIVLPVGIIKVNPIVTTGSINPLMACVQLPSDTTLVIPSGCTFKVAGTVNDGANGQHCLDVITVTTAGRTNIRVVGGGTIDVGANDSANVTWAGTSQDDRKSSAIAFWEASNCYVEGITALNTRGENAGLGEGFAMYAHRSREIIWQNCTVTADSGTYSSGFGAATGFSDSWCHNVNYLNCRVSRNQGQGFSTYSGRNVRHVNCSTEFVDNTHFNHEYSWDVQYLNCFAGGNYTRSGGGYGAGNSSDATKTYGAALTAAGLDECGFKTAFNFGGGNVLIAGCTASGFTNTNGGTAAIAMEPCFVAGGATITVTGAGPYTLTASASTFSASMVGNLISVGSNPPVMIASVTAANVCTTTLNPVGTSGAFAIWPGRTTVRDTTFSNSLVGLKVQQTNTATNDDQRRLCAMTLLERVDFVNIATWDVNGVAYNSAGTNVTQFAGGAMSEGSDCGTLSNASGAWVSGGTWRNYFPFAVDLHLSGYSALTLIPRFKTTGQALNPPTSSVGGTVAVVKSADQTVSGTTLANDTELLTRLTVPGGSACDFEIEGQIMYTGVSTTGDIKFQLVGTPSGAWTLNQQSRQRYQSSAVVGAALAEQIELVYDEQTSASAGADITTTALTAGTTGTTRVLYEFKQRINIAGGAGRYVDWVLKFAENAAGAGAIVRQGSYIKVTPLNGGTVTGGSVGSGASGAIRVQPGEGITASWSGSAPRAIARM